MATDISSDPVTAFLCQPQNLEVALEVARQVEKLRAGLHKSFWPAIENALISRLEGSPYALRWFISKPDSYKKKFTNCAFRPRFKPEGCTVPALCTCFMQNTEESGYLLNYGLVWSLVLPNVSHRSESF